MSHHHQDANPTPARARPRRGPAFSLNPLPPRSSGSQFATPPRFQFANEPRTGDDRSIFRSSSPLVQGFFRAPDQRFDNSSPLKGERNKPVQVSDDEIEDDFHDTKDTTGLEDEVSGALDELFSISRHSNKRPRASSHSAHKPVRTEIVDDDFDEINDSGSPIPDSPSTSVRSRTKNPKLEFPTPHIEPNRQLVNTEISEPKSFELVSEPQTPGQAYTLQIEDASSSIEKTSTSQNRPRFILSANYTPASTITRATSTPQPARKKPAFVLPRSPSPDKEDVSSSTIPVPFSPVATRTLRRSGRPKSGAAATYVPGGMAEHLRDWIMEADMKRKATIERQPRRNLNDARDFTIGWIDSCHNAFLKSSGPVIMARVTLEASREEPPTDNGAQIMTVLLLGAAASRGNTNNGRGSSVTSSVPGERLKPGDKVGIGVGLSWEVELDSMNIDDTTHIKQVSVQRVVPSSQSDSEDDLEDLQDENRSFAASSAHPTHSTSKTWLVAAEWDLLSETGK
ncbi:uncharacterized protein BHQ10_004174 [Talaromyces amestolkiae]|uniref:Uncharacterized protein n=1 Tax=Talaromyces amestolkiae TaxID=1196081 RepID=A0A364KX72_TALAM|nr:uncharacterized protein BHQ10_004174 [Talaromyces amestolkiae]RAO68162.1 hypothetical protein BHQ10_004174 [Talaromyces amestolkiae]